MGLKDLREVQVLWVDATGKNEWTDREAAEQLQGDIVYSVGIYISEDDEFLRLALDCSGDKLHSLGVIPKSTIVKKRIRKISKDFHKILQEWEKEGG